MPIPVMPDEEEETLITEAGGGQEFTEVQDEEVPLDNTNLAQSVKHCVLHFMELLMAAVVGGAYIGSTRKQKREIAKMKKGHGDEER